MSLDFLWQEALIFGGGIAVARVKSHLQDRLLHHRLGVFFGGHEICVALPTLDPLTTGDFDDSEERTTAIKPASGGERGRVAIHGVMLHLDDYRASHEVAELMRSHGGRVEHVLADVDILGRWNTFRNVVCIGAPRVNSALAEALAADAGDTCPLLSFAYPRGNLGTYRMVISAPSTLTVGVDADHALGVITVSPTPPTAAGSSVSGAAVPNPP